MQKRRFAPLPGSVPESETRGCDWPGCEGEGQHRAPKSRDRLREYWWFCLEHVRRYNASWNYYAGMSEDEVEADIRRDTTWNRPSWRLGTFMAGRGRTGRLDDEEEVIDPFGLFDEDREGPGTGRRSQGPSCAHDPQAEALAVLDLAPPVTAEAVRARYKELVKLHHPDANGGDKEAEERFKRIGQAYQVVMETLVP